MFDTPVPLTDPFVVEIVNQTDRWQPYVPPLVALVGSIIVAAVAFYSVRRSSKTSMLAITSADERERERWKVDSDREREKWHRDNLLRLCSDAVRISRDISHHYNEAGGACLHYADMTEAKEAFQLHMEAAHAAIGKVAPLSYDMQLLGETELAMELQEIRQVGEFVAPAFQQFHEYLLARTWPDPSDAHPQGKPTADELHASLEWRRYWKAAQHLSHESVTFQFAAQKKISPQSLPENVPTRIGPVFTPENRPDLFYPPPGTSQNPFRRPSPLDWNAGDTADPPSPSSPASQRVSPPERDPS